MEWKKRAGGGGVGFRGCIVLRPVSATLLTNVSTTLRQCQFVTLPTPLQRTREDRKHT